MLHSRALLVVSSQCFFTWTWNFRLDDVWDFLAYLALNISWHVVVKSQKILWKILWIARELKMMSTMLVLGNMIYRTTWPMYLKLVSWELRHFGRWLFRKIRGHIDRFQRFVLLKYRKHGSSSFSHTFNCVCFSLFLIFDYFFKIFFIFFLA